MAPLAAGSYPPITPFQSWVTTSWYSVPLCRLVPFCFSPLPFPSLHSAFFTRVSVSNCVSVPKKREGGRGGGHPCIDADIYAGQANPLALSKFPTGHSTTPVRGGSLRPRERGAINKNRLDSPPNVNDEWLTFDVESLAADLSEKEREKERIDPIETRFYSDYRAAAGWYPRDGRMCFCARVRVNSILVAACTRRESRV